MNSSCERCVRLLAGVLFTVALVCAGHADGGPGYALHFGGGGYVSVPHTNALNAYPLTVTAWFSASSPGGLITKSPPAPLDGWQILLTGGHAYASYYSSSANYVSPGGNGLDGGFVLDSLWHHVAFTVDATGGKLYVDGVLKDSQPWTGSPGAATSTRDLTLGSTDGGSPYLNGTLDEVTVWNVALSEAEIQANMRRNLTGAEAGLIAYYRFEEGSGATAHDSAPAGGYNDGTITTQDFVPSGISPFAPFAETLPATAVGATNATLNGQVNNEGSTTTTWFEWGTTTNYGNATTPQILNSNIIGDLAIVETIADLVGGATYHFRAAASNSLGTAFGTNQSFTIPAFYDIGAGLPGVDLSSVAWGDYDNDGRLDILLTGTTNGDPSGALSQVWRNTGSGFTNINAGLPGVYASSAAWGDYDNDGRLDILLTGTTDSINGLSQVWRNTGSGFTNINAGLPGVYASSAAWGDYDNDGRLDILLTGTTNGVSSGAISQVWRNTGSGFMEINAGLPGVYASSVAWGDYDNDGRLDILLAGATTNSANRAIARVYRNDTSASNTNTPPTPPTGLSVAGAGRSLIFSWNRANDAQTPANGLSYNLRVGTTPGGDDLVGSMSRVDGRRKLPQPGNAQQSRAIAISGLPFDQPIYWGVQAVDSAFAGSAFATGPVIRQNNLLSPPTGMISGDMNGDGILDESELNVVLSNYFPTSPWIYMTNVAGLSGTNVTFALSNSVAGTFSVEYSTNLTDWYFVGPAAPRYLFTDTNAPGLPQRYYRLRWP